VVLEHFKRLITKKRHIRSRSSPDLLKIRTITYDDQLPVRHGGKRLDDHINPLVGDQPRSRKIEIFFLCATGKPLDINRRVDSH